MTVILTKEQTEDLLKAIEICKEVLEKKPTENLTINININAVEKIKAEDIFKKINDKLRIKGNL